MLQLYYRRKNRSRGAGNGRSHHRNRDLALSFPLDGITGVTGAWSFGRRLLSAYGGTLADAVGGNTTVYNQQGTTLRNLTQTGTRQPTLTTAGPSSRPCGDFDGTDDCLNGQSAATMTALGSTSTLYVIISGIFDTLTLNDGSTKDRNHRIFIDTLDDWGMAGRLGGNLYAFNFDGTFDYADSGAAAIVAGTAYVLEWRHSGGNVAGAINNAAEFTLASGNTSNGAGLISMGGLASGTGAFDGKIFEMATCNAVPTAPQRAALIANFRQWCGA